MPDFHVTYKRNDGTQGTRVLTTDSAQDAVDRIRERGHEVVRVKEVKPRVLAARPASDGTPALGWRDFWRFKLMWTPGLVRGGFVLFTILCCLALFAIPGRYITERSHAAQRVQSLRDREAELQAMLAKLEEVMQIQQDLQSQVDAKRAEGQDDRAINDLLLRLHSMEDVVHAEIQRVGTRESLQREIQDTAARIDAQLAESSPSLGMMLLQMASIPLAWIAYRVLAEFLVILFSIHDRLIEVVDRE